MNASTVYYIGIIYIILCEFANILSCKNNNNKKARQKQDNCFSLILDTPDSSS